MPSITPAAGAVASGAGDAGLDDIEARIRAILAGILPPDAPPVDNRPLRHLGLDSLAAVRFVLELSLAFGVHVPLLELERCGDVPGLAAWVAARAGGAVAAVTPAPPTDPAARYEPFALTPLQQAYLVGRHDPVDPAGCHLYREFAIHGLDVDRLARAWQQVMTRHDALRLEITPDGRQQVRPDAGKSMLRIHDGQALDVAGYEALVHQVRGRLSHRPAEPGDAPPVAVEVTQGPAGRSVVHLSIDGALTDGVGLDLILRDWWHYYQHPDDPLPDPEVTLRDCVTALHVQSSGPEYEADLAYWTKRLSGLPSGPDILRPALPDACAVDGPEPAVLARRPLDATLHSGQWRALRDRAARIGVPPNALLLAVFVKTLAHYGAAEPYALVLTTNRRGHLPAGAEAVVGPFTSTSVLVVDGVAELDLDSAARQLHEELWQDLDHARVSGPEAVRAVRRRHAGADPVLPVVFTSLVDATRPAVEHGFDPSYVVSQTSGVAVDAQLWERAGGLHVHWDVTDAVLPPGVVDVLFAGYVNGLAATAAHDPATDVRRGLNELQQAYVVARDAGPADWDGCQVYHAFRVQDLDVSRLESAWLKMLHAYEALRTVVSGEGDLIVRQHAPDTWRIPVTTLEDARAREQHDAQLAERLVSRAFPLDAWPQFDLRVTQDGGPESTVHITLDLVACDGRSVHFLMRELFRLYADPAATPIPAAPYEQWLAQRTHPAPEHVTYWQQRVAALPAGPALPMPDAPGDDPRRTRLRGSVAGWSALRERAAARGIGPDALLMAVLTEALASRLPGPFAVPLVRWTEAARPYRPGEYTALSWLAHRPELDIWARAAAYQQEIDADTRADAVSGLGALRRRVLRERSGGYPVVCTGLLDLAEQPLPAGVTAADWRTCTPDVAMDCIAMDCGDGELRLFWDVVEAQFSPGAAVAMFERYLAILRDLAGRPLSPEDRHRILYEWNATARAFTADGPVHLRFERQASRAPGALAVRWRGGSMTYGELNARANALAWRLRDCGVRPGSLVGIRVRRGPDLAVAVYGVLKAGGAYVPVEPSLPAGRAHTMLADASAVALVTTSSARGWAPPDGFTVIDLDAGLTPDPRNPEPVASVDDLAYVIYTSGSTGTPKGVAVTHRPLHNLFQWCVRMYGFGPGDLGLCVTSLGFDLSVFDLLGLLGQGAAVYIADETEQKDPALLLDVLLTEPITFWNSAPTTLAQLAPLFPAPGTPGAGNLRLVFLSGDYTPLSLPEQLFAAFPNAKLVSLGGATEATVWSNYFPVTKVDPQWRSIPYGWPIDNCRYYILDENREPVPPCQEGDLWIAGVCLSQGYVNRPELTAERFVADPFVPGERMYDTGDRATYFPDGTICFLGRRDNQVKIRGFRVELGEIEHRLRQHPAVREAVVVAKPDPSGDRKLAAYLIPAGTDIPTVAELRRFAAKTLPDYMVPNHVMFLDRYPATPNGKLDREALPWPIDAATEGTVHVLSTPTSTPVSAAKSTVVGSGHAPAAAEVTSHARAAADVASPAPAATVSAPGAAEPAIDLASLTDEIAGLFAQLLGVERIDPEQDLWDQGATSFTMVQVSGALRKRYQRRIPVATLLSDPTVRGIAAAVAESLGVVVAATSQPNPQPNLQRDPQTKPEPDLQAKSQPAHGPSEVEFFDPAARAAFREAGWNRRADEPGAQVVPLSGEHLAPEHYRWRGTRRDFTGEPVDLAALGALLRLLRPQHVDGKDRYLYPSAGDTYAVQVYLHVPDGGVRGLAAGTYYYRPADHSLQLLSDRPRLDRTMHFFYNRELYDRAAFELFLIGQTRGIAPLYGEDAERFLALEAGYLGGLLMSGQAEVGIGLCPIGSVAFDRLRDALGLDDGHRFLQSFLGGPVRYRDQRVATESTAPVSRGQVRRPATEPLAVVGLSARFPGADDPDAYWRLLAEGRRAIRPLPADRVTALGLTAKLADLPGGFLDDITTFDSLMYRIAPAEAKTLDPRTGLVLDAVWRCLEDAGHTPETLAETGRVGVYLGSMWPDHQATGAERWRSGEPAISSGIAADLANRVSYTFGFTGPSVAVDAACSSSLAALHLASEAIRRGECDSAIVVGVNVVSHPYHLALLHGLGLLATVGEQEPGTDLGRAFDAATSGWLPGEGVGAILLRPAGVAAGQDPVHALIEATGMGHAGRTPRFAAPNAEALADSVRRMLDSAGLTPADIGYVECAAAGAAVADAAELEALETVFADRGQPLPVGTVKPNVGHLEAASGMSQLVKVVLQLRHGRLAPTLLASRRNPLVRWDPAVLRVVDATEPWQGRPRRALVNAVAATGSYAHAVVREPER